MRAYGRAHGGALPPLDVIENGTTWAKVRRALGFLERPQGRRAVWFMRQTQGGGQAGRQADRAAGSDEYALRRKTGGCESVRFGLRTEAPPRMDPGPAEVVQARNSD